MKNLIMRSGSRCSGTSLATLFLLGCLLTTSCNRHEVAEEKQTAFVLSDTMMKRIELSTVSIEPVKAQLKLMGKISADDNKLVEVYPLVGGNVVNVFVELGDYVEKGKVLAVIKSGEVAGFEQQLIDAKSDLLVAEKNLQVSQDLFSSKLASEKDVLAARNELNKANAEVERLKEVFSIYGIDKKAEYQVRAPISGFVIDKRINRDMQLRSDKADNIFTIAEISDVWVNANVYESDISKIQPEMEAEVHTLSYPDKVFRGQVNKIYNILDPRTMTMRVRIRLGNADYLLKPEMNATVTLKYLEGDKRLAVIPSQAVIFDKSKTYVMVFKDKYNIETREIGIYKQFNDITYIQSGLREGEQVVSKNQLLIYDALND